MFVLYGFRYRYQENEFMVFSLSNFEVSYEGIICQTIVSKGKREQTTRASEQARVDDVSERQRTRSEGEHTTRVTAEREGRRRT
jgi:hypothetical protein